MKSQTHDKQGHRLMTLEIEQMLSLQEKINTKVHTNWREQRFPWYRAIWTESAELLDQFGWKWWKHQEIDWNQVQLELIDIWHFGLSDMLQSLPTQASSADQNSRFTQLSHSIAESYLDMPVPSDSTAEQFRTAIEHFASITITTQHFAPLPFYRLMHLANLPMQVLFIQYVGKNALNHFRQVNGYKTGEYQKFWQGKEDNEHLSDVINELTERGATIANLYDTVYESLDKRYQNPETA